jgi:hypothetical protein
MYPPSCRSGTTSPRKLCVPIYGCPGGERAAVRGVPTDVVSDQLWHGVEDQLAVRANAVLRLARGGGIRAGLHGQAAMVEGW